MQLLPQLGGFPGFLLTSFPPLQVVQRIKAVETETRLLVVDKETDEYLCSLRLTCTEEMVHSGVLLGSGVSPTKSVGSDNGEVWKPQLDLSGGSLQRHSHSFSSHGSRKVSAGLAGLGGRMRPSWEHLPLRAWLASHEKNLLDVVVGSGDPAVCPGAVGELPHGLICSARSSIGCWCCAGLSLPALLEGHRGCRGSGGATQPLGRVSYGVWLRSVSPAHGDRQHGPGAWWSCPW